MSSTRNAFREFIFQKVTEYESQYTDRTEIGFIIFLLPKLPKALKTRVLKRIRSLITNIRNTNTYN